MDSGDLSKAIKMAYSDPVDIKIAVVPPTDPTKSYETPHTATISDRHTDPDFYETAWKKTLKAFLNLFAGKIKDVNLGLGGAPYKTGGTWQETGLSLYMMTHYGGNRKWYSLTDPTDSKPKPSRKELQSALPQFVVTGPEGTWPG
eukprot:GHVU01137931.1.p1 GENE.GHVU01137931.1~~GHVU01137931.1.p1  ORF type:complete len:145 (+),score=9.91 GHVU01137931.1:615-1049(+)